MGIHMIHLRLDHLPGYSRSFDFLHLLTDSLPTGSQEPETQLGDEPEHRAQQRPQCLPAGTGLDVLTFQRSQWLKQNFLPLKNGKFQLLPKTSTVCKPM